MKVWLFLTALFSVYVAIFYISNKVALDADPNLVSRGIDTPIKLILSGYLGQIFRIEFIGVLNLLLLPFLLYDFLRWKKLLNWQQAFLVMFSLCFGLIAVKGYFNFRYMQTLLPVSTVYVLWHVYTFAVSYNSKRVIALVFGALGLLILSNSYLYFNVVKHQRYLRNKAIAQKEGVITPKKEKKEKKDDRYKPKGLFNKFIYGVKDVMNNEFNGYTPHGSLNSYSVKTNSIKTIYDYINSTQLNDKSILCNNLPGVYYHTNRHCVYYWCEDDFYYAENGPQYIFKDRSQLEISRFIKDSLNCGYIISSQSYNRYSDQWGEYLANNCTLMFQDEKNYQFFKID